jgi:hypothetical protein
MAVAICMFLHLSSRIVSNVKKIVLVNPVEESCSYKLLLVWGGIMVCSKKSYREGGEDNLAGSLYILQRDSFEQTEFSSVLFIRKRI